ncbi:hypothetical protein ACFLQL_03065 [Verrucomicrobiota bacterium]
MKIRNGFVSNSSSSSFVLKGISIKEVASKMLDIVIAEWEDGKQDSYKYFQELTNNLEAAREDKPITLPSCNYDTYICKLTNGNIYVSTCNNHDWTDLSHGENLGGADNAGEFEEYADTLFYFDVRDCSIHTRDIYLGYHNRCSACNEYIHPLYLTSDLKLKCGTCREEGIEIISAVKKNVQLVKMQKAINNIGVTFDQLKKEITDINEET